MSYKDEKRAITLIRIETLTNRLSYLESLKKPYFRVYNSDLFSLKIEVGFVDKAGEPATEIFINQKHFSDTPGYEPIENDFFKFYLKEMFTKYQVEYMEVYNEIQNLKSVL